MAFFCFKTGNDVVARQFIEQTNKRLSLEHAVKNPFVGEIKESKNTKEHIYYICNMSPLYPHFYLGGIMYIMGLLAFGVVNWWLLPGFALLSLGVFWHSPFYFMMLKIGLKKFGYNNKIKWVKSAEVLKQVYNIKRL